MLKKVFCCCCCFISDISFWDFVPCHPLKPASQIHRTLLLSSTREAQTIINRPVWKGHIPSARPSSSSAVSLSCQFKWIWGRLMWVCQIVCTWLWFRRITFSYVKDISDYTRSILTSCKSNSVKMIIYTRPANSEFAVISGLKHQE